MANGIEIDERDVVAMDDIAENVLGLRIMLVNVLRSLHS